MLKNLVCLIVLASLSTGCGGEQGSQRAGGTPAGTAQGGGTALTGAGATFPARRMTSGGNTLVYTLFTDPGRGTVWGDGTGGSSLANGSGNGAAQAITVYGRIPSGQAVATGTYTDTITVTINF